MGGWQINSSGQSWPEAVVNLKPRQPYDSLPGRFPVHDDLTLYGETSLQPILR